MSIMPFDTTSPQPPASPQTTAETEARAVGNWGGYKSKHLEQQLVKGRHTKSEERLYTSMAVMTMPVQQIDEALWDDFMSLRELTPWVHKVLITESGRRSQWNTD